jgi:fermentation-respiration switch protein FrsA (DUF1100 family)
MAGITDHSAPQRRSRRILLRLTAVFGVMFVPVAAGLAWTLRDPVPYIVTQRSALADASVEVVNRDSEYVTERVRIRGTSGVVVDMLLRAPVAPITTTSATADSSATARRPTFLILGGYRTGDQAATLIPDTHGNIIAALAYPYSGDLGVKGLRVIPQVPSIRRALLDTPAATMLAIDYLLTRADVDSNRVELVGASFGAPFVCIAGAMDERVSRVWSVYGGGRLYDQLEVNLRKSIGFGPGRRAVASIAAAFASVPHLSPEQWAPQISPRPFVMINSSDDERIPRQSIDALYQAAQEPKEMIWLDGPHLHGSRPDVLARLVRVVMERAGGGR